MAMGTSDFNNRSHPSSQQQQHYADEGFGGSAKQLRREQLAGLAALRREGNALYRSQRYAAAHVAYSRVIDAARAAANASSSSSSSQPTSPSASTIASSPTATALAEIHAGALLNRCAVGLALLNFDGCVADGLAVAKLLAYCLLEPPSREPATHVKGGGGKEAAGADPPFAPRATLAKAWLRTAKAYAMLGSYKPAEEAYGRALEACGASATSGKPAAAAAGVHTHARGGCSADDGPSSSLAVLAAEATAALAALPTLQKVRAACANNTFKEALRLAAGGAANSGGAASDASGPRASAIAPFASDAPIALALLEAEARVAPSAARADGARYVSALLAIAERCDVRLPPSAATGSNSDAGAAKNGLNSRPNSAAVGGNGNNAAGGFSASSLLTANFVQHTCDALVCVARAAFFSGPLFAKVAAQRLSMCTALRHDHRAAAALRKEVDAYERLSAAAATSLERGKPTAAVEQYTQLLSMAQKNGLSGPLIASAALARAEVFSSRLNNTPSAISDATTAIEADPQSARAHAARSRLLQGIGDFKRALRDMATAATLSDAQHAQKEQQQQQQGSAMGSGGGAPPFAPSASSAYVNPYADDLEALAEACREERDPMGGLGGGSGSSSFGFGGFSSARPSTSSSFRPRTGGGGGGMGSSGSDDFFGASSSSHRRAGGGHNGRNVHSARAPAAPRSAFAVLGIATSASVSEVRQAYRRLVLTCHPDKFVTADASVRSEKEVRFKELSKAYADIMERLGAEV